MIDPDTAFFRQLLTKLTAEIQKEAAALAGGKATSFDNYQYRVGLIQGYERTLKLAQETEREVFGRPTRQ